MTFLPPLTVPLFSIVYTCMSRNLDSAWSGFSPGKIEGIAGGHGLGEFVTTSTILVTTSRKYGY